MFSLYSPALPSFPPPPSLKPIPENSFQLSVYPKDSLLIDGDSSKTSSMFLLRERLMVLAQQSEDLLTFERHQIIGDRIADTHLLESASSRHRVGICMPIDEFVEASVFYEKVMIRVGSTDESEIQEVNPQKTVAPPLQIQPLNEERHIQ